MNIDNVIVWIVLLENETVCMDGAGASPEQARGGADSEERSELGKPTRLQGNMHENKLNMDL